MVNIDTRIIKFFKLSESEFWLLFHVVSMLDKDMKCFPSNDRLMEDTGWAIEKLQKIKKSLYAKGIIVVHNRYNGKRQASNLYYLKTDLISLFVTVEKLTKDGIEIPMGSENRTPLSVSENQVGGGVGKSDNRSINHSEVLSNSSSPNVEEAQTLFSQESLPKTKKEKIKKKEVDPAYGALVEVWTREYPELHFDPVSGKKIKEIIEKIKHHLRIGGKEYSVDTARNMLEFVIQYAKRSENWASGKHISTFTQKFDEIVYEIKHQQTPRKANKPDGSVTGFTDWLKTQRMG